MYFPLQNTCAIVAPISDGPVPNSLYAIRSKAEFPEGVDKVGTIQAISVETGRTLWKYEQRAGISRRKAECSPSPALPSKSR